MGFVIMDEAFDVWETGKNGLNDYHLYFTQWAQTRHSGLRSPRPKSCERHHVEHRQRNPGRLDATAANLIKWVKAIDSTRPLTWACNDMGNATNQAVAALLDLQGYNYLQNGSITSPIFDGQHASHPTWKIFGSEMESGGRSRGFYSTPADNPTTWGSCDDSVMECSDYPDTDASPAGYEQMYVIDDESPWFAGEFDWTGFDYGGEPWPYAGDAKSSYFGIVDTAGFPKNGYYFWQSRRTTAPMVHIFPHWNWTAGTSVDVSGSTATATASSCSSTASRWAPSHSPPAARRVSGGRCLGRAARWWRRVRRRGTVVATDEVDTAASRRRRSGYRWIGRPSRRMDGISRTSLP